LRRRIAITASATWRGCEALRRERLRELRVTQVRCPRARQRERHVQHDERGPVRVLEHAVAVAETARGRVHRARGAVGEVEHGQRVKAVLHLGPVRADVLDRRCAHRARDQGHVLQAAEALRQGPFDECMPVLARAGAHEDGVVRRSDDLLAGERHVQHERIHLIPRDQEVAAAAEHEPRQRRQRGVGRDGGQVGGFRHAHVAPGARGNAERVESIEGNVV
jgi:hypothetical protein